MAQQQKHVLQFSHLAMVFRLFQESLKPTKSTKKATARDKADEFSRIRCPLCKWRPKRSSRWFCGDCDYPEYFSEGCGTAWNTFTTRGRCPGCGHQWRWTICLSCHRWSQHEEWYQDQN